MGGGEGRWEDHAPYFIDVGKKGNKDGLLKARDLVFQRK